MNANPSLFDAPPSSVTGELVLIRRLDSGWAVFTVNGQACTGTLTSGIQDGDHVRVSGKIVDKPHYGEQLQVEKCERVLPKDDAARVRYLERNFKGIGPKKARDIIDHFGEDVFTILDTAPERIKEVKGISEKLAGPVLEAWIEKKRVRSVDEFWALADITPTMQRRIYAAMIPDAENYKDAESIPFDLRMDVVLRVQADPYLLIQAVDGIGFKKADGLAQHIGIQPDNPSRIKAGILHAFREAADRAGHCYLPAETFIASASGESILGIDDKLVREVGREMVRDETLKCRASSVYLKRYFEAENAVAAKLHALAKRRTDRRPINPTDPDYEWLTVKQCEAIVMALGTGLTVITGLPGTGKTTILKSLVKAFGPNTRIELAAPTGKAAKRMTQQIGQEARTIHRLLEYHPEQGWRRNAKNPIDADVVIIDESSMIDIELAKHLLAAIDAAKTSLVLVGDVDQLPSVGPGRFLADVLDSGCCPSTRLMEILRQGEASGIVKNAHRIHAGEYPERFLDFAVIHKQENADMQAVVLDILKNELPRLGFDSRADVQVLCPMKDSPVGTWELNKRIQDLLNPFGKKIGASGFRVGDRVIQTKNQYERIKYDAAVLAKGANLLRNLHMAKSKEQAAEIKFALGRIGRVEAGIFNGETGAIHDYIEDDKLIRVRWDDGDFSDYGPLALNEQIMKAYAVTIHKSQGSEYPVVIIPMSTSARIMLQRNLIYTAITRGAKHVFLVGMPAAIARACKHEEARQRYTGLRELLHTQPKGE